MSRPRPSQVPFWTAINRLDDVVQTILLEAATVVQYAPEQDGSLMCEIREPPGPLPRAEELKKGNNHVEYRDNVVD